MVLARDLMQKIGEGALPPVLLFGPGKAPFQKEAYEPVLAERAVAKIVEAYVEPSVRDLAYSIYYADETPVAEIVQEAQTLPFLAERRVVVVRNAERYNAMSGDKKSLLYPLIEYLGSPNDATLLLLIASKADKRKKFYKGCQKAGEIVECPQLTDGELGEWIRGEVSRLEKEIDGSAVDEIMQRAGGRLGDVLNAITLVATYIDARRRITLDDVVAACADVAEESVWALTDAIAASNTKSALRILYQLLDLGKSPDEIMGLINWLLESAYRASPDTTPKLKSNFVAQKVMPLAQKLGVAKLAAAFALCTDTHFMIRSTGVDKILALELLVVKLATPRKRRQA